MYEGGKKIFTQDSRSCKRLTNINPLYVSFAIDLLSEQKRFTICQRIHQCSYPKTFCGSYKRYYDTVLVPEVKNQYMINDTNLKELFFPRAQGKNEMDILHAPVISVVCSQR